jgi:hypothetical protein
MELDLQIYLGSCVQLYSLAETPHLPNSRRIWTRTLLVGKDRRHLFITPWPLGRWPSLETLATVAERKKSSIQPHLCTVIFKYWVGAMDGSSEPKFVNLSRSPGIDSQPGEPVRQPYLTYRPARAPIYNRLKVPKCEILMSWILIIFFIMKSLYVGDLRAVIKFLHFLQMGEILAILF